MLGIMGRQMHLMAKGVDGSEVEERVGVKSLSHETTFEEGTADLNVILQSLEAMRRRMERNRSTKTAL
jgi:nucleotidyltransferase/DNA polymerase involved in DNA repair